MTLVSPLSRQRWVFFFPLRVISKRSPLRLSWKASLRDGSVAAAPVPPHVATRSACLADWFSLLKAKRCLQARSDPCCWGSQGKWKEEIRFWLQALKTIVILVASKPERELTGICQAVGSHTFGKYFGSDSPLNQSVIFLALFRGTALSLG